MGSTAPRRHPAVPPGPLRPRVVRGPVAMVTVLGLLQVVQDLLEVVGALGLEQQGLSLLKRNQDQGRFGLLEIGWVVDFV